MTVLVGLALLFLMTAINVPIAIGLGLLSVIGIASTEGWDNLVNLPLTMFSGTTSFPLLAIPMFILAGALMNTSSISRRLINFIAALIGFVRGGLAMVNVGVSMVFAEISGSAVADVAAIGSVLIPAMKRRGYTREFAAAVTSSPPLMCTSTGQKNGTTTRIMASDSMKQPSTIRITSMRASTSHGSKLLAPAQPASAAGRPARVKKPFSTSAPNRMK